MTKIKICGLTRACDIQAVNTLLPDYIGFVFAPNSKRYLTPTQALELRRSLDKRIIPVGVFVNESIDTVAGLVLSNTIATAQLHGNETNDYVNALRKKVDCKIIQAFQITTYADIEKANNSAADYILLDSGGGTGKTFDHKLLTDINRPFFLAGGIACENVAKLINLYQPYAVDASSSLETNGFKDTEKMKNFVNIIRGGTAND